MSLQEEQRVENAQSIAHLWAAINEIKKQLELLTTMVTTDNHKGPQR